MANEETPFQRIVGDFVADPVAYLRVVAALLPKHQINEFTGEPVAGITVTFVKPPPIEG